jgi:hypothetical protein
MFMPTLITVNVHKPGTSCLLLVVRKNSGPSRYQVTHRLGHPLAAIVADNLADFDQYCTATSHRFLRLVFSLHRTWL